MGWCCRSNWPGLCLCCCYVFSANRVDLGFFYFINFAMLPPPPRWRPISRSVFRARTGPLCRLPPRLNTLKSGGIGRTSPVRKRSVTFRNLSRIYGNISRIYREFIEQFSLFSNRSGWSCVCVGGFTVLGKVGDCWVVSQYFDNTFAVKHYLLNFVPNQNTVSPPPLIVFKISFVSPASVVVVVSNAGPSNVVTPVSFNFTLPPHIDVARNHSHVGWYLVLLRISNYIISYDM